MGQQGPLFTADIYMFSSSCSLGLLLRNAQGRKHSLTPLKPSGEKGTQAQAANYRISEGQTGGWACSDFKIQRKLKYLINWSMPTPLQKYELSSMKWASNGELSTHDIHKLLSKLSQAQAFERQNRCLEPTESTRWLDQNYQADRSMASHKCMVISVKLNKKFRNALEQLKRLSDPKFIQ